MRRPPVYRLAPAGPLMDIPPREAIPGSRCVGARDPRARGCLREATGPDGRCTFHALRFAQDEKRCFEAAIARHGFTLRYVDFCEDATTPGIPGAIGGVTLREQRVVKVAVRKLTGEGRRSWRRWGQPRSVFEVVEILRHELRHVADPTWDCGNRAPLSL